MHTIRTCKPTSSATTSRLISIKIIIIIVKITIILTIGMIILLSNLP